MIPSQAAISRLQLIGVVKPRKPCRGVELSHGMVGEREGNHPQIAELVELSEAQFIQTIQSIA